MTQEQEKLLLKDLCARLPYGVICKSVNFRNPAKLVTIDLDGPSSDVYFCTNYEGSMWNDYDDIKPYLFPMSSMTDEQKNSFPFSYSFLEALIDGGVYFDEDECITLNDMIYVIQWCYKNHFDIYGLIPMGLANDATDKNIY